MMEIEIRIVVLFLWHSLIDHGCNGVKCKFSTKKKQKLCFIINRIEVIFFFVDCHSKINFNWQLFNHVYYRVVNI